MFSIGSVKIPNYLAMAPMCGITQRPFRQICKSFGAGLVFTQMVAAKALTMGDKKSKRLLDFDESERPIGFQVFGHDADVLAEGARIAQDLGADIVDLNMGCPARKIVHHGGGSALLKSKDLAKKIFEKMRAALTVPFTVKMRSGWDKNCSQALEIAKLAEASGVDAIILHARTRMQGYSGASDWKMICDFKKELSIPVIGNGDVTSAQDAACMRDETGCDAVMIGRAAFARPWLFKNCLDQNDDQPSKEEIKALILKQYESFFEYYGMATGIKEMRKYLCAYTKGLRDAAKFRNEMVRMVSWTEIQEKIREFL